MGKEVKNTNLSMINLVASAAVVGLAVAVVVVDVAFDRFGFVDSPEKVQFDQNHIRHKY